MYRPLPDNATHVHGIKLSPWTADPNSPECSMRIIEGGDPTNVAHRVAFIEKTPRVRFQPFDNTLGDWKNWHQGWKGSADMELCFRCRGEGRVNVLRTASGTRRSPRYRKCPVCSGTGNLPEAVVIPLRGGQRAEVYSQYHEDAHILDELAVEITDAGVLGSPAALRELAKLIAQDYSLTTGFETVRAPLKREMLCIVPRILGAVGPQESYDAALRGTFG